MIRRCIEASFGLMMATSMLSACALFLSFDDYQTNIDDSKYGGVFRYRILGTVKGLEGDAKVAISVDVDPASTVTVGNGPFELPKKVADGYSFRLVLGSDSHTCSANPREMVVAGADAAIAVDCLASGKALSALSVSKGSYSANLFPAFEPPIASYRASLPLLVWGSTASLVANTMSPTSFLEVMGTRVSSGAPASIPWLGPVDIKVTSANGEAGTYSLQLGPSYLKAETPDAAMEFGSSVAISGDTLAVGVPGKNTVVLFKRDGGVWSQEATVTRNAPDFGRAVALSGDTLAVGAPFESSKAIGINGDETDTSANQAGAVYVFTRGSGGWTQQAYVKASNTYVGTASTALFGRSVALSADTLAVGAPGEMGAGAGVNATQAVGTVASVGAAYVFIRRGEVWKQEAYIKASNSGTVSYLSFGKSLALSGDTLAVGAPGESSAATGINTGSQADTSAARSGAVYVFTRTASAWSQQAYVKQSNTRKDSSLGTSVSLAGDTLVAGATGDACITKGVNGNQYAFDSSALVGAAYVFTRSAGVWSQQAYFKASNAHDHARFGSSAAIVGDTIAVGAETERSPATGVDGNQDPNAQWESGAVYVFRRNANVWSQAAYVKSMNTQPTLNGQGSAPSPLNFGSSVVLGDNALVIGAPGDARTTTSATGVWGDDPAPVDAPRTGAVWVY